jgi:hypothetical protein
VQATFAIYSFLRQREHFDSINVITDVSSYYNDLARHINVLTIDAATVKEWKGPYDYPFRVKIKAAEYLANRYPGDPILFSDSDTFLFNDIGSIKKQLLKGTAFLHEDEGALSTHTYKRGRAMWAAIRGKEIGGWTMKDSDLMWNSGVIASPNTQQGKEFAMAAAICDGIASIKVFNHTLEQFGLGLALTHYYKNVAPAHSAIAHYWGNKEGWNELIMAWLAEHQLKQTSHEGMLASFGHLDLHALPIVKKTRGIADKLHWLVDKQISPKKIAYIPGKK